MSRIAEPDVLDVLTRLVEKSLVVYEDDEQGRGRYRLLETVRQYARDRLIERGEAPSTRDHHRDYFLALAEQAKAELFGGEQTAWLERLEEEHDNLRASLAWSGAQPEAEPGLRLGGALWRFWSVRGYLAEGAARLRSVLSRPAALEPTVERARALDGAGLLAMNRGDFTSACEYLEEALTIGQELDDKQIIASARNSLGDARRFQGETGAARCHYEEALRLGREVNDRWNVAYSLTALGIIARDQRDYRAARSLFEEGLAIKRVLGDKRSIAYSLGYLAGVALDEGEISAARSLYEESLARYQELGDRRGIALTTRSLAGISRGQRNYDAARELYREGLAISRELGDRLSAAGNLEGMAAVAAAQGQFERAARLFAAVRGLHEAMGIPVPSGDRTEHDPSVTVHTALGEAAWAVASAEGSAMTMEEAIAYALEGGE